jgi:hypothetical protein
MKQSCCSVLIMFVLMLVALPAQSGTCPSEPPFQNFTGAGATTCPCFAVGEQAGVVFDVPAAHYPIEILKVGIGYGSQAGGNPQVTEEAVHIYEAGLPDPGFPIFSLGGPILTDGVINEFDLEPEAGEIIINSGPFSVALEFALENSEVLSASSVVHDGNGCQSGKNLIRNQVGDWFDVCLIGLSGDWVFTVTYRKVTCTQPGSSGAVPTGEGGTTPLTVDRLGSNLLLNWGPSCSAEDIDYEIYEGTLGMFTSHEIKLCSTGTATGAVVGPRMDDAYYLVVPRTATAEGSYGMSSTDGERPAALVSCLVQEAGACTP